MTPFQGTQLKRTLLTKGLLRVESGEEWTRGMGGISVPLCVSNMTLRTNTRKRQQNTTEKWIKKTRQSAEKRKKEKKYGNMIVSNPERTLKLLINIQYVASCSVSSLQLDNLEINCIIYY